jgi:threonyl-tRNA synthetase
VLPISDKVADFAEELRARLANKFIRVKLDDAPDKIGAKIRNARLDRVPYMLVVGQREAEEGKVSVRHRELDVVGTMGVDEFIEALEQEISQRLIRPALASQTQEQQ